MNYKIYCIEDINDFKYVGSTNQKLNIRLSQHRSDKKLNRSISSSKLNLYNCIIYELEKCNEENKKEREQSWINKLHCVNINNIVFDKKEWRENNKQKTSIHNKKYCENNKDKIKEYRENNKDKMKEYRKLEWYCSACKCNVKKCNKSRHLKSQKHHLNTIIYV